MTAIIFTLILTFTGRQTVVQRLTCGKMGKRGGKGVFYHGWILGLALTLIGNACVAVFITENEGYGHLRLDIVFALLSCRPTLSLPWAAFLRIVGWRSDGPPQTTRHGNPRADAETQPVTVSEFHGEKPVGAAAILARPDAEPPAEAAPTAPAGEYVYVNEYISTAIAQLIIQIIASVFIGVTWSRFPNEPIKQYMDGVLIYMELLPLFIAIGMLIVPFWRLDPRWLPRRSRLKYAGFAMVFYVLIITAPWVYWTYFLSLPGSL